VVVALLGFTVEGARFIFGDLVYNNVPMGLGEAGSNAPIQEIPGQVARTGASFAFNVLPTIIFFSALMTVLYHVGIMQWVVKGFAWVMQKTLGTSGAETLSAAGNIFVGQTEAPLLIKPFFEKMTMSELHAVMTAGFATVAGGVLADLGGNQLLTTTLLAGDAGLVAGTIWARGRNVSRSRARLISIAGVIGGLAGAGLDLLVQPDDEKVAIALPLAGSITGLAVGARLTSEADPRGGSATGGQAGDGGSVEAGSSLLRFREGRFSFGVPTPFPTMMPVEGPRGFTFKPALGLTLLDSRF